ncbi:MAG: formate/nitrite transporter family protein [Saprospiraceae bacterium]|nr:formate/nitrite transporter family protein [Saprospiraceae bacterium]
MEPNHQMFGDAYAPSEIAKRVSNMGVTKANADFVTLFVLGVMAGAFSALGGLFCSVVITDSTLGFGITRLIGGSSFCLGLVLVVIGGAELFTGNNLLAMAWASKKITTGLLLRNWVIVYTGNVIGALLVVAGVYLAETAQMAQGGLGETLQSIAVAKSNLTFAVGFSRGVLCNTLVCLAVWLAMGGHTVTDKILAILFPITAFVTMGFEHSIANWFFIPMGMMLDQGNQISMNGAFNNLLSVTLGNIVGGSILVAGIYWIAYLRNEAKG